MRTKLASIILTEELPGGDENSFPALIPPGLPVQPSSTPGKFEIAFIDEKDSSVDHQVWDYWFCRGIELEREQVEDGLPPASKRARTVAAWLVLAVLVLAKFFPLSLFITIPALIVLERIDHKRRVDEWGPVKMPEPWPGS